MLRGAFETHLNLNILDAFLVLLLRYSILYGAISASNHGDTPEEVRLHQHRLRLCMRNSQYVWLYDLIQPWVVLLKGATRYCRDKKPEQPKPNPHYQLFEIRIRYRVGDI